MLNWDDPLAEMGPQPRPAPRRPPESPADPSAGLGADTEPDWLDRDAAARPPEESPAFRQDPPPAVAVQAAPPASGPRVPPNPPPGQQELAVEEPALTPPNPGADRLSPVAEAANDSRCKDATGSGLPGQDRFATGSWDPRYDWAWQKYLEACSHSWQPSAIDLDAEAARWRDPEGLTDGERALLGHSLEFFATLAGPMADFLILEGYPRISAPECRCFLLRQAFEITRQGHAWRRVRAALVGEADEGLPPVSAAAARQRTWLDSRLSDPGNPARHPRDSAHLLYDLTVFYLVLDGLYYPAGVAPLLALGRGGRLTGTAAQARQCLRETIRHTHFGIDLINQIKLENPSLWTEERKEELAALVREAVALETARCRELLPRGLAGLTLSEMEEFLRFTANRRGLQIGLPALYPEAVEALSWLVEDPSGPEPEADPSAGLGASAGERIPATCRVSRLLDWD